MLPRPFLQLALLALAAAAPTPPVPAPEETAEVAVARAFPPYPGGGPLARMGDEVAASGRTLRAASFETRDAPADVIAFYDRAFAERGLFVTRIPPAVSQVPALTAMDAANTRQLLVWAEPRAKGTLVTLAVAPRARGSTEAAPPVPLPSECDRPTRSDARDGPTTMTVITAFCRLPPGRALAAARSSFSAAGYAEARDASLVREGIAAFRKKGESWQARATAVEGGSSLVLVRVTAAPPEGGADGGAGR